MDVVQVHPVSDRDFIADEFATTVIGLFDSSAEVVRNRRAGPVAEITATVDKLPIRNW